MDFITRSMAELFIADSALVRFLIHVNQVMGSQVAAVGKPSRATRAFIRLLTRVNTQVTPEILCTREALLAVVAPVRGFPGVDAPVAGKVRALIEGCVTFGTLERLLTRMCPHVLL